MNTVRIGEVLVQRGVLNAAQVAAILDAQSKTHRPFGEIAENMYGIDPTDIEQAWVQQYARLTAHVDVLEETADPRALGRIDRRQAWQFRLIPVRYDGRELMVATTPDNLCRALRFVTRCLGEPCYIVLTQPETLGAALEHHYPMPGMSADAVGPAFSAA
ncbi:MAG: hypothetical protein SFZ24_08520 [Planctomycetota bacterium]|nr:hypothetical protein [Planctomycetota bacterium]